MTSGNDGFVAKRAGVTTTRDMDSLDADRSDMSQDQIGQWLALRVIGAGLLFATGAIHLDLYLTGYRTIPTIGWLFLLQVITAFGLGADHPRVEQPSGCGRGRRVRDRNPRWLPLVVAHQPLRVS